MSSSAAAGTTAVPDDKYAGAPIAAMNIILGVLSALFVAARFWSRKLTRQDWGLDDWLALGSLVANTGLMAISINAVINGGLGRSTASVMAEDPNMMVTFLKCIVASTFCYGLSSPLIKLSLLAFYWRVFPTKSVRWGIYALSALCIGWLVAIEVTNIVQCIPLEYFWTQLSGGQGRCVDLLLYFIGNSIANCAIDILTLVFPIREVLKLQVSQNKKIGICCVFLLGSIVVVASLVRFGSLVQLYATGVTDMPKQYALMWTATVIEIYVAIIGACAVTLVPVYRRLRYGTAFSTNDASSNALGSGHQLSSGGRLRSVARHQHQRMPDDNESDEERLHGGAFAMHASATTGRPGSHDASSSIAGGDVPMGKVMVKRDTSWMVEEVSVDTRHEHARVNTKFGLQ